jgi:hypothetical protein
VKTAFLILILFTVCAAPVSGFHQPVVAIARGPELAEVEVNGVVVFRLRGPNAPVRAAEAADRLRRLDLTGRAPVTVQRSAGSSVVVLGRTPILTIDRSLARSSGVRPSTLAVAWAQRLRQALTTPRVLVAPKGLSLIPGERVLVRVHVFPQKDYLIGKFDRRVIDVQRVPDGIVVSAKTLGATMIPLRGVPFGGARGAGRADVPVAVRRPAADLPFAVEVEVTGNPSDPALVQEAIRHAVLRETQAHPGSDITIGTVASAELAPGDTQDFPVPVRVRNPFRRSIEGVVRATVRNVSIPLQTPARLLVSNRPEVVVANGVLFSQTVSTNEAVRLLYHHQNGAEKAKLVTITLANRADEPARMLIVGAVAGPSTDLMFAGQAATSRFLRRLARQQGYVIDVPSGHTHTFTVHEMPPGSLVSGLLQAQTLTGRLDLAVHIRSPWLLAHTITSGVNQPAYPHPHGTFQVSEFSVTRSAMTRDRVPLVDLGIAVSPVDPATGVRLIGDYGIVYRVVLEVRNLSEFTERFSLRVTAAGGAARGMFLIDNEPVDVGILRPNEEREIFSLTIPGRESRTLTVVTMPVAGSFYPVRLTLNPEQPTP